MRRSTAWTLNVIDKYCDYFEKYKNLIKWEDPIMTRIFFIALVTFFVIVTFMPIRLFFAIGYIWKYYKGQNWQNRRQNHNREICRIELQHLFDDLKIKIASDKPIKKKEDKKVDVGQKEEATEQETNQGDKEVLLDECEF
jgi:hypothetical protein